MKDNQKTTQHHNCHYLFQIQSGSTALKILHTCITKPRNNFHCKTNTHHAPNINSDSSSTLYKILYIKLPKYLVVYNLGQVLGYCKSHAYHQAHTHITGTRNSIKEKRPPIYTYSFLYIGSFFFGQNSEFVCSHIPDINFVCF